MSTPIKITITAYDGTATGLLKYTTSPIKAEVYFFSKATVCSEHMPQEHGAYILLGQKNGKKAIYVGMSKQLQKRLKQHVNTAPDGIVWNRAIAIAAVDKHFLAGIGSEYLEADLYQKALNTNNWELANLTPVVYPSCPTVDKVAYDNFLEEVYLLIELAGYDIFKTITDLVPSPAPETIFIFQIDKYPALAEQISRKEFILKKGAKIADKPLASITNKQVARLRKKFQAFINPEYFTIADIQFDSANAAAIFIVAYKFSGKKQWKNVYGERPK